MKGLIPPVRFYKRELFIQTNRLLPPNKILQKETFDSHRNKASSSPQQDFRKLIVHRNKEMLQINIYMTSLLIIFNQYIIKQNEQGSSSSLIFREF